MWVRGHLAGIKSPLSLNGSRDLTQVIGLGSMLLYLLPRPLQELRFFGFFPDTMLEAVAVKNLLSPEKSQTRPVLAAVSGMKLNSH